MLISLWLILYLLLVTFGLFLHELAHIALLDTHYSRLTIGWHRAPAVKIGQVRGHEFYLSLVPFGGCAEFPENVLATRKAALAGPMASLIFGILNYAIAAVLHGGLFTGHHARLVILHLAGATTTEFFTSCLFFSAVMGISQGVFNLIPCGQADGSHVFRRKKARSN